MTPDLVQVKVANKQIILHLTYYCKILLRKAVTSTLLNACLNISEHVEFTAFGGRKFKHEIILKKFAQQCKQWQEQTEHAL